MPSPFPGMDPYLEGYLWADVHQGLAAQIRRQLAPLLAPAYVVRLAVAMLEDRIPGEELSIIYPDVEVVRPAQAAELHTASGTAIAPAPLTLPLAMPTEVRQVTVEIRDAARQQLITAIEILSPVNKREPGHANYLAKRDDLRAAGVHLLEVDLLRRGLRTFPPEQLPSTPYLAALLRAHLPVAAVWPIGLCDSLPTVPVPLRAPDPDAPLDLHQALAALYAEARYELSLDYTVPPLAPPLTEDAAAWARACVERWQRG